MHARFSRTTAVHESPIIPTEYTLYQNHPNPFNPETNIEFALPKPEQVRLRIFDVYGREVRFLFTMWLQAGLHAVKWDGRDDDGVAVGSGVYFYRLQAGSFTETKKLVLMR
jgi:flagellar hook assembly protein FlgD